MIKINKSKLKKLSKRYILLTTTVVTLATFISYSKGINPNYPDSCFYVLEKNDDFDEHCKNVLKKQKQRIKKF